MIIDHRTYTVVPGKLKEFVELYKKEGMPVQTKYLTLHGYFTTEVGNVNQIVHMWRYESLADREQRRAKLMADPAWQAYGKKAAPYFTNMENKILVATDFSPKP